MLLYRAAQNISIWNP